MKALAPIIFAAVAALSLTACADYDGYSYGYGPSYGYGDYGGGYYDGFYGPIDGGYWGGDGVFMYRDNDGRFHRDVDGHFRRHFHEGFHAFHGRG